MTQTADAGQPQPPKIKRMRRSKAAEYLREQYGLPVTTKTLSNLNSTGRGPKPVYYGSMPLYNLTELDRYGSTICTPENPRTLLLRQRREQMAERQTEEERGGRGRGRTGVVGPA
jgi:hypothetical protein